MLAAALLLGAIAPARADAAQADLAAYVKARAADADGAVDRAVGGYSDALNAAPDNVVVAIRAYREALAAGDFDLVRRAVTTLRDAGVAPADAPLFALADAVRHEDWKTARLAVDGLADSPLDFMQPILSAWVAYGSGSRDPVAILDDVGGNALARRYATEQRALLLIATDRTDAGLTALQTLLGTNSGELGLRMSAAQLLAGKGRGDVAKALLAGDGPMISGLRDELGDGREASVAFGISRLYGGLASTLKSDRILPLSILLGRSALLLDSGYTRARLLLADSLSRANAIAPAQTVLAGISDDSVFAHPARAAEVSILQRAGKTEAALASARKLAEGPNATLQDMRGYGDMLVGEMRYEAASQAYGRAIAMAGADAGWSLYLQRGGALEQAGHWDRALPMLQKAHALAPDEPVVLNYLGYAQIERGENLNKAQKMLERASTLSPDDPSITDSLGWAYYQRGSVAKALPLLEKAAKASPADATINEHLGDAYWRVGRRYEARYAWRAAAVTAENDEAARIADKLATGLAPGADR